MIKDSYRYFIRLQIIIDGLIVSLSYATAWYIKFRSGIFSNGGSALTIQTYFRSLYIIVPMYLILYRVFNLYSSKRTHSMRYIMTNILKANVIGLLAYLTVLYMLRQQHFSRTMLFIFFGLNVISETFIRLCERKGLVLLRKKGFNIKKILLVGCSHAAEGYIDRIKSNPQWGYQIMGILDDNVKKGTVYKNISVIGRISDLDNILDENELDELAVTLGLSEYSRISEIVGRCEKSGIHTQFIPDYNHVIPTTSYTEDIQGLPVINIRYVPLNNEVNAMFKRILDFVGAAVGIIVLSPVMAIIAIAVKLTSKGPLIYSQERIGRHNRPFMMYKFRTMRVQPEDEEKKC